MQFDFLFFCASLSVCGLFLSVVVVAAVVVVVVLMKGSEKSEK